MIISGFTDLRHIPDFLIGLLISLQQSAIFLKQNPTKAHLTIDQLRWLNSLNHGTLYFFRHRIFHSARVKLSLGHCIALLVAS